MAEAGPDDPVSTLAEKLTADGYVADRPLAMALHLALALEQPLLLEGEPGVGKTSVAESLATVTGSRLVRLQCYEGLTAQQALYEWDYVRQLLSIRLGEAGGQPADAIRADIFGQEFLLRRPLLDAIWPVDNRSVVLLVDEVDRADEEFEALLLEILSQFQITIPEIGTIRAKHRPTIVLTANRTRALSDALRRRCLYHWIPFPDIEREMRILHARLPAASTLLTEEVCRFIERVRAGYYRKSPGVSETVDWLRALTLLGTRRLSTERIEDTLGVLLKDQDDLRLFRTEDGERVYRELGMRVS